MQRSEAGYEVTGGSCGGREDKIRYVMDRRDHKAMPNQIYVKEKLRSKMAHGVELLKPLRTDLAARTQPGPHNDPLMLLYFLSNHEEECIKGEEEVAMHARTL